MRHLITLTLMLLYFSGCGTDGSSDTTNHSSSSSSSSSNSSSSSLPSNPLTSQSFTIDEHVFDDTSNFTKLQSTAKEVEVTLSPQKDDSILKIVSSDIIDIGDIASSYNFKTTLDKESVEKKIGKPLFIDDTFAGIVKSFDNGVISVEDADDISKVYSKFDIQGAVDSIDSNLKTSIKRSIQRSIGRYDILNKEPLKITFSSKSIYSKQRKTSYKEPIVTIEFPKGYTMPLREISASTDCEISEAMCDASFNYNKKFEQSFDKEKTFGNVTFSTRGSKIEIGLGAFIHAMYDYNTLQDNQFYFEFKPTAYYLVDMQMSLTGTSIAAGDKTFELLKNGLDISIPLGNKFVQLNVNIVPELVLGMEDAPNNKDVTFKVNINSSRSGYIQLIYSSDGSTINKGIEESSDPLVKSAITFKVDTGKDKIIGYTFPEIAVRPQLSFTKITKKINIATVRNGARIDTKFKGIVDDNWIVENENIYGSTLEDIYLKSYLYGLIDYKWDIKIGNLELISSDNWSEIYKSGTYNILEWFSQFLQQPTVKIESHDKKRFISFDIKSKYKPYIRYYYSLDKSAINKDSINDARDNTSYKIWHDADKPIELSENKTLKVRAVLFTDEIPEKQSSKWVWGMSISKEVVKDIVYVPEPKLSPTSKDFSSSITVTITQDEGDDIYISHDGVNFSNCGTQSCSVTITKTEDFFAKTMHPYNNKEYFSSVVHGYYSKCNSSESIGSDGKCATKCPYLWELSYVEEGELHEENSVSAQLTNGTMRYKVVINPNDCKESYGMSSSAREKCTPYENNVNLPPLSLYTSCQYISGGNTLGDNGGEGYIDNISPFGIDGDMCNDFEEDLHIGGGENCIFKGYTSIIAKSDMAPHIIQRKAFNLQTNHGIIYFTPLSYIKDESEDEGSVQSSSSSSSSSSIDNQSDNDNDNGDTIDGTLNEDNKAVNWKVTLDFSSSTWGSGNMNIDSVKIDCNKPSGFDDGFSGQRCSIAEYSDESSKFNFNGVLEPDPDKLEFFVATKSIELNVIIAPQQQIHLSINTLDNPYGSNDMWGCNGTFKDDYLQNFKNNKAFSINTSGANSCTLTFTPLN